MGHDLALGFHGVEASVHRMSILGTQRIYYLKSHLHQEFQGTNVQCIIFILLYNVNCL